MKRVLIISPYFPPSNAADMQRIRMSLPYFKDYGWEAEVVQVSEEHSDINRDPLLIQSLPPDVKIHMVDAFSKKWTSKIGLGSIALRSLWYYKNYVNQLVKKLNFDLIYFSTTQFPVCTLGAYWKKKHKIPFVIDMQDPWHSDYYENKPKSERPPKYWFSYRLNKYTERMAMDKVDGLISVSSAYLDELSERYENVKDLPKRVITFGAFKKDFDIAKIMDTDISVPVLFDARNKNFVYIGRGGYDMHKALKNVFQAFKNGLDKEHSLFSSARFYFIGTSYASAGEGKKTIAPLAEEMGIANYVIEHTDRAPFYSSLKLLQQADALLITGSDDPGYTASKIYPYMLTGKPILALFHKESSAVDILKRCYRTEVPTFDLHTKEIQDNIESRIRSILNGTEIEGELNVEEFKEYTASYMTMKQCELFDDVLKKAKV